MSSQIAPKEVRGAIMQPTYLPWIGYFALMAEVDIFVMLDSVQFHKHSWQQRNRIKTAAGIQWLTVPVLTKGRYHQLISEVEINPTADFQRKHIRSIEIAYRKAPFFNRYSDAVFEIISRPHHLLVDLSMALIAYFASILEIKCKVVRSTEVPNEGHKSELLINICEALNITHYISPPGSSAYLVEDTSFPEHNIRLSYSDYRPASYPQLHGEFFPLASIIDCLFTMGPECAEILDRGRNIMGAAEFYAAKKMKE